MANKLKIFVAGSKALDRQRTMFRAVLSKMQNLWRVTIEVCTFEDFSNTMTIGGRQADYNKYISEEADLVAFIYNDRVGQITEEEFSIAYDSFCKNKRPEILVYANKSDEEQIEGLKKQLNKLNQYYVEYENDTDLVSSFTDDMNRYMVNHHFEIIKPIVLKKWVISLVAIMTVVTVFIGYKMYGDGVYLKKCEALKIETAPNADYLVWSDGLSLEQLLAVNDILSKMISVEGGTFLMGAKVESQLVDAELEMPQIEQTVDEFMIGKYEVSVSEYCQIMQFDYDEMGAIMPMTNVSFDDCLTFVQKLKDMTNLNFRLPTEAEWEYASRGGKDGVETVFAGSNTAKEVAWFKKNSGGKAHKRNDEKGGLRCNSLDIYDMSGNVSEWCDTPFRLYIDLKENAKEPEIIDPDAMVVRGGNYDSEEYDVTVTHREPMNRKEKSAMVGFRLVLDKN